MEKDCKSCKHNDNCNDCIIDDDLLQSVYSEIDIDNSRKISTASVGIGCNNVQKEVACEYNHIENHLNIISEAIGLLQIYFQKNVYLYSTKNQGRVMHISNIAFDKDYQHKGILGAIDNKENKFFSGIIQEKHLISKEGSIFAYLRKGYKFAIEGEVEFMTNVIQSYLDALVIDQSNNHYYIQVDDDKGNTVTLGIDDKTHKVKIINTKVNQVAKLDIITKKAIMKNWQKADKRYKHFFELFELFVEKYNTILDKKELRVEIKMYKEVA